DPWSWRPWRRAMPSRALRRAGAIVRRRPPQPGPPILQVTVTWPRLSQVAGNAGRETVGGAERVPAAERLTAAGENETMKFRNENLDVRLKNMELKTKISNIESKISNSATKLHNLFCVIPGHRNRAQVTPGCDVAAEGCRI